MHVRTEVACSFPQLKPFAIRNGNLNYWDGSDKGFTWDTASSSEIFITILIPILLLTSAVMGTLIMATSKIKQKLTELSRNTTFGILFWSSGVTLFFANIMEVATQIHLLYLHSSHPFPNI